MKTKLATMLLLPAGAHSAPKPSPGGSTTQAQSSARPILLALLIAAFVACLSSALAQGTAFTYQGQLQNNGSPASGTYNFTFSLFTNTTGGSAVAGPVVTNGVVVAN